MSHNPKHRLAVFGLSVLSLALLAGCSGLDDSDTQTTGRNRAPEAVLNANHDVADTGDSVTFDAKGSSDEDGEIVSYSYSFGDGTTTQGAEDDAPVRHTYARGGAYVVTLTVTDDGHDQVGALSDTDAVAVTVNQEFAIAAQPVSADPLGLEGNATFDVYASAERFELDLDVTGSLLTGSSEIEVKVLDQDGGILASGTVTVQGTDRVRLDLDGPVSDEGVHAVQVTAKSGAANVSGSVAVFYGAEELDD